MEGNTGVFFFSDVYGHYKMLTIETENKLEKKGQNVIRSSPFY